MSKRQWYPAFISVFILGFYAMAGPPMGVAPTAPVASLQSVLDSGAVLVYVPAGVYQLTETLRVGSNVTLFCDPGVVLEAAPGAFKAATDVPEASLVSLDGSNNVTIENCTLRMLKATYTVANGYPLGEWRHCLRLSGVTNVRILNVRVESSGGDGCIVQSKGITPSTNVTINRMIAKDNYRTGLAVCGVDGLTVRDSEFNGTKGTPTNSGVDIEPSLFTDRVNNIVFERCKADNNAGSAYLVQMVRQNTTSASVSITFTDCSASKIPQGHSMLRVENWGWNANATKPVGFVRWDATSWTNP